MKKIFVFLLGASLLVHCQKEDNSLSTNANQTIYVQSDGAAMRVNIRGNTSSKVIMVVVHGGPGGSGYFYRTPAMIDKVERKYAVAYWDQRVAGASQGGIDKGSVVMKEYGEDLKKIIQTLRYLYGQDLIVFLMGQSWGGMVCAQFMTEGNNQDMVNGWMAADAVHNWVLDDSLSRAKLLDYGAQQIAANHNVVKWQSIVSFCLNHQGSLDLDQSAQLETYAFDGLSLIDGFTPFDGNTLLWNNLISENIPLTNFLSNSTNPANRNLINNVRSVEFSSTLYKVTKPVLVLSGDYDFVVPEGMGIDMYQNVGSMVKEKKLFLHSGHNMEEQDAYMEAFVTFMDENK